MNKAKVDHFIEFSKQPYIYQDASYGTRVLKLESGERITMPNVVRTVTKSTLISEYQKHCRETEFSPLSRATLFRILEVKQASQRKSLHGLDNTAADGSSAFNSITNLLVGRLVTPRCVNPEPTEPASKLGFYPILNLSSCVVLRGSLSRRCHRCILSTFSLLKLIGLLIFLYQGLYCL